MEGTVKDTNLLPKPNAKGREILKKALAIMRRYPETVDMSDWVVHHADHDDNAKGKKQSAPYCGTVACIAGHVALVATRKRPDYDDWGPRYLVAKLPKWLQARIVKGEHPIIQLTEGCATVDVPTLALAALGIHNEFRADVIDSVFVTSGWPVDLEREYNYAQVSVALGAPRKAVKIVTERVRQWLRKGM